MKFVNINTIYKQLLFKSKKIIQKEEFFFKTAMLSRIKNETENLEDDLLEKKILDIYK